MLEDRNKGIRVFVVVLQVAAWASVAGSLIAFIGGYAAIVERQTSGVAAADSSPWVAFGSFVFCSLIFGTAACILKLLDKISRAAEGVSLHHKYAPDPVANQNKPSLALETAPFR